MRNDALLGVPILIAQFCTKKAKMVQNSTKNSADSQKVDCLGIKKVLPAAIVLATNSKTLPLNNHRLKDGGLVLSTKSRDTGHPTRIVTAPF